MPTAEFVAWAFTSTVVACLGGPLLGVAVGRWWPFPGAGVVAAILLVVIATGPNLIIDAADYSDSISMLQRFSWLISPWIVWLNIAASAEFAADGTPLEPLLKGPGSPVGHLIFTIGLCGLVVWAAVTKNAESAEQRIWRRYGIIALVVAVGGLLWAVLG